MSLGDRLVGGALLALGAGGVTVACWGFPWVWKAGVAGIVFGVAMFLTALQDRPRKRRLEAEVDRALHEWDDLCRAVGAARGRRENIAVLLQERGYREFNVRRWIMSEVDALVAQARHG